MRETGSSRGTAGSADPDPSGSGALRSWSAYSAVATGVAALAGLALQSFAGGRTKEQVWVVVAVALGVQYVAFGLLIWTRSRPRAFVAGWVAGILLRMGALAAVAVWVVRSELSSPALLLVGLAGILFALLLLEAAFYWMRARSR